MNQTATSVLASSPYPGLRPFEADEAEIFFGREAQTDQLLDRLQTGRLLAIVGPSGCGKSSLVRAGMIAALKTGLMSSAGSHWRIAQMRPGGRPIWRLASALGEADALALQASGGPNAVALTDATLRRGPLGLLELLQEGWLAPGANLLLLVDQFEEIFRFRQQDTAGEADAFIALLLATAEQTAFPVYIVLTMRSDFLGDCSIFAGLPEAINRGQYLTPRMTREQIRRAIVGPARVFDADVDPALANCLLNEIGTDPDQLPLLQHALMRMWQRMTDRRRPAEADAAPAVPTLSMTDYDEVGAIAEALSKHADQVYDSLAPPQQRIAELMFRRLTDRATGKRDTRRPARVEDIAAVAGAAVEDVIAVAEEFRRPERSFITPPTGVPLTAESVLDIGHETLIRCWDRLNRWVEDEARSADIYLRLKDSATRAQAGRAALWQSPDLDEALIWREQVAPNSAWATRYGSAQEFEAAMSFLERSQQQAQAERVAAERARSEKDELERQRREEREQRLQAEARAAREMEALERKRREEQEVAAKRSHRLAFAAVAGLVVAVIAAAAAGVSERRAREQAQRATQARVEAQQARLPSESWYQLGRAPDLALLLSVKIADNPRTPLAKAALIEALRGKPALVTIMHQDSAVSGMAYSGDGKLLVTGGNSGALIVWDADRLVQLARLEGHKAEVDSIAFSPDGTLLASGDEEGAIVVWDIARRAPRATMHPHHDEITGLAFSPDGHILASASLDGQLILWDVATIGPPQPPGAVLRSDPHDLINAVAFNSDGTLLASGDLSGNIRVWDVRARAPRFKPILAPTGVSALRFSPDKTTLVSGDLEGRLTAWRFASGDKLNEIRTGNGQAVLDFIFFPAGDQLAAVGGDGNGVYWTIKERGSKARNFMKNDDIASGVAFNPVRSVAAVGKPDGAILIWDVDRKQVDPLTERVAGYNDGTLDLTFAPDGSTVHLVTQRGEALRLNVADRHSAGKSAVLAPTGSMLTISADGGSIAAAQPDGKIVVSDPADGKTRATFPGTPGDEVVAMAFSPDAKLLGIGTRAGMITVWDAVRQVKVMGPVKSNRRAVETMAISPDGATLAAGGDYGTLTLWNVTEKKRLDDIHGHRTWVSAVAFSRDGRLLASGDASGMVMLSDVASATALGGPMRGHHGTVFSLSFGPDRQLLASSGADGAALLWDVAQRKQVGRPFKAGSQPLLRVAFSPDGKLLAAGEQPVNQTGGVLFWNMDVASWRQHACHVANRNLSCAEWRTYFGEDEYKPVCPELPAPACARP